MRPGHDSQRIVRSRRRKSAQNQSLHRTAPWRSVEDVNRET